MKVERLEAEAGDGWIGRVGPFEGIYARMVAWLPPLALLALRLPVAVVFWRSGRTKVEGWNLFALNPSQPFLFEHEFGLPFPALTAQVTAIAEHVFPAMLVLGLATRLGAAGMLAMTAVIQLFVFPGAWFSDHMWWAVILFAVLALGPGTISLDHVLTRALATGRRPA
jgi:putative oxidoreductase